VDELPAEEKPKRADWLKRVKSFVLALAPTEATRGETSLALAEWYELQAQYDEALKHYQQAQETIRQLELRALMTNNYALLLALHQPEKVDTAQRLMTEAISVLGPQAALLDTRATVYLVAKEYQRAATELEAALATAPTPAMYYHFALVQDALKSHLGRDRALARARELGLKPTHLHPLEWPTATKWLKP
jgi:tetratricopeptide (TPR) repeat protein